MEDYLNINHDNNMKMLNEAVMYCYQGFSHQELIDELSSDNEIKKQLCIIELKNINSQNEADLLVYNLTGKSGPIREAASFKILELVSNQDFVQFFQSTRTIDILIKGITDINPAVSRNMVEAIKYIIDTDYLIKNTLNEINNTLNEMNGIKQNRSYVLNKKNFNLYWNLEALISVYNKIELTDNLINIIVTLSKSKDYTIREKIAKLISLLNKNDIFLPIINLLKNDENIYVSRYFKY